MVLHRPIVPAALYGNNLFGPDRNGTSVRLRKANIKQKCNARIFPPARIMVVADAMNRMRLSAAEYGRRRGGWQHDYFERV